MSHAAASDRSGRPSDPWGRRADGPTIGRTTAAAWWGAMAGVGALVLDVNVPSAFVVAFLATLVVLPATIAVGTDVAGTDVAGAATATPEEPSTTRPAPRGASSR